MSTNLSPGAPVVDVAVAPVVAAADAVADGDYVAAADAVAVAAGQSEPRLTKMFGESPVQFAAALG